MVFEFASISVHSRFRRVPNGSWRATTSKMWTRLGTMNPLSVSSVISCSKSFYRSKQREQREIPGKGQGVGGGGVGVGRPFKQR